MPDEVRRQLEAREEAPTLPVQAAPGQVLEIRFRTPDEEQVARDFQSLRELFTQRPGETPVVLYVPAGTSRALRMELGRRVAYDVELLADIRRRLGERLVAIGLRAPSR